MSTAPRPSLWRVLLDTWRIISSNALHFTVLSVLFIFPMILINVIHILLLPPSPSPPSQSGRLLAALANHNSVSKFPSLDVKTQILYTLITLIFNLCAISSVTTSIYDGLRSKPLKLAASLKSILSSFLPLLATKLVYFLITAAIAMAFGFCMGFLFFGLAWIGIDVMSSKLLSMVVPIVATVLLFAVFLYVEVQLCLAYAVVVVESKYGYAPLKRSWSLVKGVRPVAFLSVVMLTIVQMGLGVWLSAAVASHGGCAVAQMLLYAALSTVVGLFWLGATTVFLVRCKEFHGESEESMEFTFQSDENKLAKLYVQLPHDVVDQV